MTATYILAADGVATAQTRLGAYAWVAFSGAPTAQRLIGVNYASAEQVSRTQMLLTGILHGMTFLSDKAPGIVRLQLEGVYAADAFFQQLDTWPQRQGRDKGDAQAALWTRLYALRGDMQDRQFRFIDDRDAVFKNDVAANLADDVAKIAMQAARRGTHMAAHHPLGNLPGSGLETIMTDIQTQKDTLNENDLHHCC